MWHAVVRAIRGSPRDASRSPFAAARASRGLTERSGYKLDESARVELRALFGARLELADRSFGNGRYVRNTFEAILRNQALRLAHAEREPTREDLMTLVSADIVVAPD